MDFFMRASSSKRADIDLPLYKEEALTGSTNHALRSLMLSRGMYPTKATFEQTKQVMPINSHHFSTMFNISTAS
jgi:hypothetical protein